MSLEQGDSKSRVLQATDIVALIGQTVSLRRRGKDFVGLCPFHTEKTPSFHVSPARQFFHCYGCKAGGNAIDFVIKRDRVEFIEAMKTLADAAGIDLPRFGGSKEKVSERKLLLDAHSAAGAFFEKLLSHPQAGSPAREYLEKRGFTAESIRRFQLGVAPNAWDGLLTGEVSKKFRPDILALAGLVKKRENGVGHYDTFRNRLMFPIRDEQGRIIAFGGRVMPGSDDPAKYLNSPETSLFSKGRCVYGLDLAKAKAAETRTVVVVEGYTDVVMAHQFGVDNVVSVLGTALTDQHVSLLRRFADRIVLLFDADSAGELAVDRAVELFLTQPVEIAIATLPEGVDPDEMLLEKGADGFAAMIAGAIDALSFKWGRLWRRYEGLGDDLTARQRVVEEYLTGLAAAKGSGSVDSLRWGAALARVSRLTDIPVEALNRRFRGGVSNARGRRVSPGEGAGTVDSARPNRAGDVATATDRAERWILGMLLVEPGRWHDIQAVLGPEDFTDETRRGLAEVYWDHQRHEGEPAFNEFLSVLAKPEWVELAVELVEEIDAVADRGKAMEDAVEHLGAERGRRDDRKLMGMLRKGERTEGVDEVEVLRRLQERARRPDLRRS